MTTDDQASELRKRNGNGSRKAAREAGRLRCLAVGSGKGGVGKTVVSVGLSYALVGLGYRVLVVDADLGLANVDLQVGAEPHATLQDVLFGHCELRDAVVALPRGPNLLAAASGAQEMVDLGGARRQMFVEGLVRFAADYDYLIIDVAAGIGANVTNFLAVAPEVLVVVANEPTSVMDAYALIKTLARGPEPPAVMTVVNMVRSTEEGRTLAEHLDRTARKFLGVQLTLAGIVPFDPAVREAVRMRRPVAHHAPACPATRALRELAGFLAFSKRGEGNGKTPEQPLFDRLLALGEAEPGARKNG